MWWWSTPVVIGEADGSDADLLAAVHASGFEATWSADDIAALLREDTVFCVVARRASPLGSQRPVGFLLVRVAADEAEVLTVAVLPAHRRRGIGRLMIEHALRRLYHDRVGALFLEVDAGNAAALALYSRLGFREVGKRTGYYRTSAGERSTALVMRRDLR